MSDLTKIRGRSIRGAAVALTAKTPAGAAAPWNVLAYAVDLKARGAELTRAKFDEAVANFSAYGSRVPVALFHADTDAKAHPEARKAHAWITELRVGSMKRKGKPVATLEGRFEWVNEATQKDVQTGALAYGSVTFFHNAIDEETGEEVGGLLYSFSLTNNPALVDLPRLAAARDTGEGASELGSYWGEIDSRDDLIACLRAVLELPVTTAEADVLAEIDKLDTLEGEAAACAIRSLRSALRLPLLTTPAEVLAEVRRGLASLPAETAPVGASLSRSGAAAKEPPMSKLILLAATLGFPARDEADAEAHVSALASEAVDVRRALGTKTAAETATKLSSLSTDAARVPALEAKVSAFEKAETERVELARAAHVDAVVAARPELKPVRASLELHARHDFDGFAKSYPLPSAADAAKASQLAADNARLQELNRGGRITPGPGTAPEHVSTPQLPRTHVELARDRAAELMKADPKLSERDALLQASKDVRNGAVSGAKGQ